MNKLLELIKAEPVYAAAIALSVVLAGLITAHIITIEDLNRFVATLGLVVPIVLGAFGLRKLVTPATGVAAATRKNAVVAETMGRVASGAIPPEVIGGVAQANAEAAKNAGA